MKRSSESKYLKTAEYARQIGCTQRTVHRNFHKGLIPGFQDKKTKTIYIENPDYSSSSTGQFLNRAILYARVSSSDNRKSLDGQLERMRSYCFAKGYTIVDEIKEIRSGLNDQRPKLDQILKREDYDLLVCEHKDRLTRFGFHYLETLLERCGIQIVVINQMDTKDQELMDDFVSIVTSFCNRIYGRKRKRKQRKLSRKSEIIMMSMVNEKPCSFLIRTDGRRNALALRRLEFCTAADTALLQELNHETRIQRLAGWNKRKSFFKTKKIY